MGNLKLKPSLFTSSPNVQNFYLLVKSQLYYYLVLLLGMIMIVAYMLGGHHFFVYPKGVHHFFSFDKGGGGHVLLRGVLLVATSPPPVEIMNGPLPSESSQDYLASLPCKNNSYERLFYFQRDNFFNDLRITTKSYYNHY